VTRRKNLTQEDKQKMREMEAQGKARKVIAIEMDCEPSSVTRVLGAVRKYKDKRCEEAEVA
jgi:hypothetical protein